MTLHEIENVDPTALPLPAAHAPSAQNCRRSTITKQSDSSFRFDVNVHIDGFAWSVVGSRDTFDAALQATQVALQKILGPLARVSAIMGHDGSIVYVSADGGAP